MWKFLVKNQSIEILEREVLADHQIQYVQFKFTFDGDWKRFHKVVQFSQCDEVYNVVLGTDGTTLYLPAELHVGAAKMSVFGYDTDADTTVRATTVPVTLNIRPSGFEGDDDTPIPPTPDLYVQLLKRIEDAEKGLDGKSAYELAVQEGYTGTLDEWLASLHGADGKDGTDGKDGADGKDGITPDMSEYPKTTEVETIIQQKIAPVAEESHTHDNKATLDSITPELFQELYALQQFEDQTKYDLQTLEEEIMPLQQQMHTHDNKAVLDSITPELFSDLNGLQQFEDQTKYDLQTLEEEIMPLQQQMHTHDNKTVLDSITEQYMQGQAAFHASTTNALHGLSTGLSEVSAQAHSHANAEVLNQLTQEMIDELGSIYTVVEQAHWHHNLTVLNSITAAKVASWEKISDVQAGLAGLTALEASDYKSLNDRLTEDENNAQQFQDQTTERLHTAEESINNFSNTAHTHENKTVLDSISQADITKWNNYGTQINGISTNLTVVRNKVDNNESRIAVNESNISALNTQCNSLSSGLTLVSDSNNRNSGRISVNENNITDLLETVESLQAQIDNLHPYDTAVTLFRSGIDALHDYGENIYTFYNDGYRSLTGFADSYPNFCCEEYGYALYYNQPDFNWGAVIYTQCVTPVRVSADKSILISYKSGAADSGEMWLVPKNNTTMSAAETARYIHETIMAGNGINVPFNWLQTADAYTTVLLSCNTIADGEYYLAWKAVTDNTHPFIRLIKILEV